MDDYWEDGYWRDGYWGLFWETGAPEFYLLRQNGAAAGEGQPDPAPTLTPIGGEASGRRP